MQFRQTLMELVCNTEMDMVPAAHRLLLDNPGARVFALYGSMGAGKTTFVKAICQSLGVLDIVQSPTFSLINEYMTPAGEPVYHFDFYRIKNVTEVFDIGYEDYLYSGNLCFLEWPGLVEDLLPDDTVRVTITGETARLISY